MGKRGRVSIKHQVHQALQKVNYIGVSKYDARKAGDKGNIHSYTQIKHAYSVSQNFATWLKEEHGIKDLYKVKRADYRDYIAYKDSQGVTKGHLANIETNLRHLEKGMNRISKERGFQERDWIPKQRIVSNVEKERPVDRSYTRGELEAIRQYLPESARNSLDLQMAFGVRLDESTSMNRAHIRENPMTGKLEFHSEKGNDLLNSSKISKGGRPRTTEMRPEHEERVKEIIKGKADHGKLTGKYDAVRKAYERAAEKAGINYNGTHGVRHSYARLQLDDKLKEQGIYKEGREVIQRMIENKEAGFRKDYGFTTDEKGKDSIYQQVNEIVDSVHGDLGHGIGRTQLMVIYMK